MYDGQNSPPEEAWHSPFLNHGETSLKHLRNPRKIKVVPRSSEKANIKPIFKKRKKEDWDYYRLVSFTSVPGKVTGQRFLQPSPHI